MATRDYKARERPRTHRARRGGSGFFWFVTGAVLGAFGVALAWMLDERPPPAGTSPQARNEPTTKPSFVFHQLLPEMEVLVPDEELSPAPAPQPKPPQEKKSASAAKPAPATTAKAEPTPKPAAEGGSYLVQVASFRRASDAERLKARLALLGIRAQIQGVTVNGKDYHRVRAGPYKGKQEVNETRALLSSKGLESITVKLK